MKALSEMISFWDGRGPSEKTHTKKSAFSFMHANNQLNKCLVRSASKQSENNKLAKMHIDSNLSIYLFYL